MKTLLLSMTIGWSFGHVLAKTIIEPSAMGTLSVVALLMAFVINLIMLD